MDTVAAGRGMLSRRPLPACAGDPEVYLFLEFVRVRLQENSSSMMCAGRGRAKLR